MPKRSIALVVPALALGGGVPAVVTFLYRLLAATDQYRADIISLATARDDVCSVRLLSPSTWFGGVQLSPGEWNGLPFCHIGAFLSEFEFQRYRPRRSLTRLLNQYDLVQVVAGHPPWALVASNYKGPVALQVATLVSVERVSQLKQGRIVRRLWSRAMTAITARLESAGLKRADAVLVENSWMCDHLATQQHADKTIFAPPGVDTDVYRPGSFSETGHILSVGRFADPRKNVQLLFRAYHQLLARLPDAPKLVLAGNTSPRSEDWAVATALGISNRIELHHDVSVDRLRELYRTASLFVLSSDEEGLGIVILEAMASALPVVSTRCGGPQTAVAEGETGYLTPVGDAHALASRIEQLVRDPMVRRRMGAAGRRVAEERFSIQAAGRTYLDTYAMLLKKAGKL